MTPTSIVEALALCRGKLVMVETLRANVPVTQRGVQELYVGFVDVANDGVVVLLHVDEKEKRRSYFEPSAIVCFHEIGEVGESESADEENEEEY